MIIATGSPAVAVVTACTRSVETSVFSVQDDWTGPHLQEVSPNCDYCNRKPCGSCGNCMHSKKQVFSLCRMIGRARICKRFPNCDYCNRKPCGSCGNCMPGMEKQVFSPCRMIGRARICKRFPNCDYCNRKP